MRRVLPVLVVLLAVLAIAWFLRPAGVGEETGELVDGAAPDAGEAPPIVGLPANVSEAHLEGRSDAVAAPAPTAWVDRVKAPTSTPVPRLRIHGTVRDERGLPVPRAVVYQLPHEQSQGTNWVRERAETDEKGAFAFLGHPPLGTWICARQHGRRTVFLEGAEVARDGEVHLVLEEAPPLIAQFVDEEARPVWFGSVRAVPVTRRGADCAYPGPQSAVAEQLEMTGPDGTVTFRFEARVPVVVVPEVESMVTQPRELRVPGAEGSFTFQVVSAGGLELKAVDEGGRRIAQALWISVLDPHTGEELASYRSSEKDGALEVEPSLPPGPYHFDVSARGYEPSVIPDLVLPVGPAVVKKTITLRPLAKGAVLTIHVPDLPDEARVERGRTDPTVFLLRKDEGWEAVGWTRRAAFGWQADASTLTLQLRPGTYEVVLCRPQDGSVATLGPLTLASGRSLEKRVRTVPGIAFALYDVLPPELTVRAVRIIVPGRGIFFPTGSWFSTAIRDAGSLIQTIDPPGSAQRRTKGGGALLGPYPGPHVTVEVDDWRGRTHRFTVGG